MRNFVCGNANAPRRVSHVLWIKVHGANKSSKICQCVTRGRPHSPAIRARCPSSSVDDKICIRHTVTLVPGRNRKMTARSIHSPRYSYRPTSGFHKDSLSVQFDGTGKNPSSVQLCFCLRQEMLCFA
ncbi:regulator of sigma E protease [Trypanosoma cruzi]|nr:regulator of sigma E protease [Trypanosoma cruzi]